MSLSIGLVIENFVKLWKRCLDVIVPSPSVEELLPRMFVDISPDEEVST